MGLPFIVGAGIAGLNFIANESANRGRFDEIIKNINDSFEREKQAGISRITLQAQRSAAAAGLGGGTAVNSLVEDLINNFLSSLESRKRQALNVIENKKLLFESQRPTTFQNVASSIASGAQAGLNVFGLQGGFDKTVNPFDFGMGSQQFGADLNIGNPIDQIFNLDENNQLGIFRTS